MLPALQIAAGWRQMEIIWKPPWPHWSGEPAGPRPWLPVKSLFGRAQGLSDRAHLFKTPNRAALLWKDSSPVWLRMTLNLLKADVELETAQGSQEWAKRAKAKGSTWEGPYLCPWAGAYLEISLTEGFGLKSSLDWLLPSNLQNCLGHHRRTDFPKGLLLHFACIWTGNTQRNALACNILCNLILFVFPIMSEKINK